MWNLTYFWKEEKERIVMRNFVRVEAIALPLVPNIDIDLSRISVENVNQLVE